MEGEITKYKIVNFTEKDNTGVSIKSLLLDKEIAIGDQLNINDKISFEPDSSGMIPGEYTLEYKPIIKEPDNEVADYIQYYGNYNQDNYKPKEFLGSSFKIIYKVKCHEKNVENLEQIYFLIAQNVWMTFLIIIMKGKNV